MCNAVSLIYLDVEPCYKGLRLLSKVKARGKKLSAAINKESFLQQQLESVELLCFIFIRFKLPLIAALDVSPSHLIEVLSNNKKRMLKRTDRQHLIDFSALLSAELNRITMPCSFCQI